MKKNTKTKVRNFEVVARHRYSCDTSARDSTQRFVSEANSTRSYCKNKEIFTAILDANILSNAEQTWIELIKISVGHMPTGNCEEYKIFKRKNKYILAVLISDKDPKLRGTYVLS